MTHRRRTGTSPVLGTRCQARVRTRFSQRTIPCVNAACVLPVSGASLSLRAAGVRSEAAALRGSYAAVSPRCHHKIKGSRCKTNRATLNASVRLVVDFFFFLRGIGLKENAFTFYQVRLSWREGWAVEEGCRCCCCWDKDTRASPLCLALPLHTHRYGSSISSSRSQTLFTQTFLHICRLVSPTQVPSLPGSVPFT